MITATTGARTIMIAPRILPKATPKLKKMQKSLPVRGLFEMRLAEPTGAKTVAVAEFVVDELIVLKKRVKITICLIVIDRSQIICFILGGHFLS